MTATKAERGVVIKTQCIDEATGLCTLDNTTAPIHLVEIINKRTYDVTVDCHAYLHSDLQAVKFIPKNLNTTLGNITDTTWDATKDIFATRTSIFKHVRLKKTADGDATITTQVIVKRNLVQQNNITLIFDVSTS